MKLKDLNLPQKALLALLVILFPLTISFIHSYFENREQMKKHTLDDLTVIAEAYEGQVYQFLEMVKRRTWDFSSDGLVVSGLERVLNGEKGAAEALSAHLKKNKLPLDKAIVRIGVISMEGRVLASSDSSMTGRDVSSDAGFKSAVRSEWGIAEQASVSAPEIISLAPVISRNGKQIGFIATAQSLSYLNKVLSGEFNRELGALSWSKGKRKTMEAYLVNRDRLMITESQFIRGVLQKRVENEPVRLCLQERKEFSGYYPDYRGVEVAGASMCMPSLGWTLLLEVDAAEILAPVKEIKRDAIVASLITGGLILLVFYSFYRSIVSRLAALSIASSRIAEGEYDITVDVRSNDEIGLLSGNFNKMSSEIKTRTTLLKESEQKYRSLLSNIPDVTWTSDSLGRIVYVSENVRELFGYSPGEVCSSEEFWKGIIHPDDLGRIMAAYQALFENGRHFDEQYRMRRKDGSWAWVFDRATFTYDKNGARLADGLLSDITERRMSDLLQSISFYLKDAESFDSAIKLVITKVCELTGWSYGEVWTPKADGSSLDYGFSWHGDSLRHGRLVETSMVMSIKPGAGVPGRVWQEKKPLWLSDVSVDGDVFLRAPAAIEAGLKSALGVPVVDNGKVLAVLVFLMSEPLARNRRIMNFVSAVTAQLGSSLQKKLSEEAHLAIQQRYEELLDSITVGVYRETLYDDNAFLEVNRTLVTMLDGTSVQEIISHRPADFYVEKDRRAELKRKLAKDGCLRGEEAELVTLKGRRIWVSVSAVKKNASDGRDYVEGILEDISERKRLEEQLRHSQKLEAVGQLAGGVAHDFNNILTAIIGYGNLLLMKKGGDETVRNFTEHMLTLSEKAAHLTQSLLVFSRKQVMNPQPLDINGLITRVEKILARIIGEDILLKTSLVSGDTVVRADSTHLEQVFMNLATNARDAMQPSGGVLAISTGVVEIGADFITAHGYGEAGRYVLVTVSDSGHGMDAETRKRIFEPFFTTKEVGKGTGLGLAVVYGIVKQHNGFINVYSEPGMGSTFKIYLPIIDDSEQHRTVEPPEEIQGGRETVLLAEDEPEVREVNRKILEEFGYSVIEASDGEEAVERFRENSSTISVLLLDLMMPKKNGKEAFEEIIRIRPGVRAVFMSGYAADLMRAKGALGPGTEFISKPVSPGDLLRKVRETIDR